MCEPAILPDGMKVRVRFCEQCRAFDCMPFETELYHRAKNPKDLNDAMLAVRCDEYAAAMTRDWRRKNSRSRQVLSLHSTE